MNGHDKRNDLPPFMSLRFPCPFSKVVHDVKIFINSQCMFITEQLGKALQESSKVRPKFLNFMPE